MGPAQYVHMTDSGIIFKRPPPHDQLISTLKGVKGGLAERARAVTHLIHPSEPPQTEDSKKQEAKFFSLLRQSDSCLYTIHSVFPFDFFPDDISIEQNQVNVVNRTFFLCSHIQSIPITNVSDVFVESGPFFSTIRIVDKSYIENSVTVKFLKKSEALHARKIIQGLIVAINQHIDMSQVPDSAVREHVHNIGRATGVNGSF